MQQQSSFTMPAQQSSSVQRAYAASGYQASSSVYQGSTMAGSRMVTGGTTSAGPERVQSTRKISSTIVNEQMMGPMPQDFPVREVEVPGPIQEIVTHVPRKEIIETERRVPKYEYEYVDKIVEVPRIQYVDKVVEVPKYQDVIIEKKVPQIVDVPREVVREVKVPKINYVEKTVEVPGEIIEVPKPYTVEQKVEFTRYTDRKRPVVVAQTVKPMIVEGAGVTEVDVYEYEPECIPVDVHVVKGVQAQVQAGGVIETTHRVVSIPAAQYNSILQQLNSHLTQTEMQKLPFLTEQGQVTFLGEHVVFTEPQPHAVIEGLEMSNMVSTHVDQASRKVQPVNDSRPTMTTTGYTSTSYVPGTTSTSYVNGSSTHYQQQMSSSYPSGAYSQTAYMPSTPYQPSGAVQYSTASYPSNQHPISNYA